MHLGTCTSPYFTKLPNSSFHYSRTLTKLDMSGWDFSNVTSIYNFSFYYTDQTLLTDVYAFKNYGKASSFTSYANDSNKTISCYSTLKNISKESLLFLLNGVYDLNITCKVYDEEGNPGTGKLKTQKISLSSAQKAMLTPEEIAIATNKG